MSEPLPPWAAEARALHEAGIGFDAIAEKLGVSKMRVRYALIPGARERRRQWDRDRRAGEKAKTPIAPKACKVPQWVTTEFLPVWKAAYGVSGCEYAAARAVRKVKAALASGSVK